MTTRIRCHYHQHLVQQKSDRGTSFVRKLSLSIQLSYSRVVFSIYRISILPAASVSEYCELIGWLMHSLHASRYGWSTRANTLVQKKPNRSLVSASNSKPRIYLSYCHSLLSLHDNDGTQCLDYPSTDVHTYWLLWYTHMPIQVHVRQGDCWLQFRRTRWGSGWHRPKCWDIVSNIPISAKFLSLFIFRNHYCRLA